MTTNGVVRVRAQRYEVPVMEAVRHRTRTAPREGRSWENSCAGKIVHPARRFFLVMSDHYRYQGVWRFAIAWLAYLQFG